MDNVIQFPLSKDPSGQEKALKWVKETYLKAGLTNEQVDAAVAEFRPHLERFSAPIESSMELPAEIGLTQVQCDAIAGG